MILFQGRTAAYRKSTLMFILLCSLPFLSVSCDLDWKERASRAAKAGYKNEIAGRYKTAAVLYRKALKSNPYHPAANYRLGNLYDTRLLHIRNANQLALRYYQRYLDLKTSDKAKNDFIAAQCALLKEIISGSLEDPVFGVSDMLTAAREKSLRVFIERLHPQYFASLTIKRKSRHIMRKLLSKWEARVKSGWRFTYRDVRKTKTGYQASVGVRFGDRNKRRLVLMLSKTRTWELAIDEPDKSKM